MSSKVFWTIYQISIQSIYLLIIVILPKRIHLCIKGFNIIISFNNQEKL